MQHLFHCARKHWTVGKKYTTNYAISVNIKYKHVRRETKVYLLVVRPRSSLQDGFSHTTTTRGWFFRSGKGGKKMHLCKGAIWLVTFDCHSQRWPITNGAFFFSSLPESLTPSYNTGRNSMNLFELLEMSSPEKKWNSHPYCFLFFFNMKTYKIHQHNQFHLTKGTNQ